MRALGVLACLLAHLCARSGVAEAVKNRVVLFVLDGVGEGAAEWGGLPGTSGDEREKWSRGSVTASGTDSSAVVSALATGCDASPEGSVSVTPSSAPADKISQRFARSGYSFALLTTKCADDGTASAFVASASDRYDLRSVGESAATLHPAPALITGGFSKSLWNASVAHDANFVEFESGGGTAYSETCEYPRGESLERRVRLAMDRMDENHDKYLLVVVATGFDVAAHSGDARKARDALIDIRGALRFAERRLERGGGDWKIIAVGSHDTGGVSSDGALSHARHSPGARVPVLVRGARRARVREARTMGDVSRLLSEKMTCTRERSHVYVDNARNPHRHSHPDPPSEAFLELWFSFVFFFLILAVFLSCLT